LEGGSGLPIQLGLGKAGRYDEGMKIFTRSLFIGILAASASVAWGAMPQINVTVLSSSGKTTFKGATNANGSFASGKLEPGEYVVQFNSKNAPKTGRYALIASAGKEKVVANGIPGEKLVAGVAVTIRVGSGLNVTAQITAEDKNSAPIGRNGKLMVWIPKRIGSNLAPHWAESDSAEAKEVMASTSYSLKNMQNKMNQGVSPLNDTGVDRVSTTSMQNPATGR
jgi:hypothetical protein